MIDLVPINGENISHDDVSWLVRIANTGYHEKTAEMIANEAMQGRAQLWRIGGAATGLMVTKIRETKDGRALWIEGIAGEGLVPRREELLAATKQLAEKLECGHILALLWDKALVREAQRAGAEGVGIAFRLEV